MNLKILHITPLYPNAERPMLGTFVKTQIESLKNTGEAEIDILVLPSMGGISPYLSFIPEIRKAISSKPYDIIHAHYGNAASLIKLIYRGKTPVITSYCGDDLLGTVTGRLLQKVKSRFFRRLNIFMSRFDAASIVKSALLSKQIKGSSPNVHIIPNGVDTDLFRPMDRVECRKQLGIKEQGKVILFAGNVKDPNKNFSLLTQALDKLPGEKYHILTLGKGVKHSEMPLYMNAADLVVCTSRFEGSPNTVKEAMACNAKVFSTPCGDVTWLLEGAGGSKVLGYDPEEWRKNLELFTDGKLDGEPSDSRQELIRKQLDTPSIANIIINLYKSCAGRKA